MTDISTTSPNSAGGNVSHLPRFAKPSIGATIVALAGAVGEAFTMAYVMPYGDARHLSDRRR